MFRRTVRQFIEKEFAPQQARWREQHAPDADAWTRAGVHFGCAIQSTVAHYILAYGTEEQKRKWLPRLARGERVAAIAMTEPGAGSDLQAINTAARRDGEHYVINGSKTFITNASHADLVCLAVKTDAKVVGMRGLSLVMV
jgi:acyl-CoA dehydrogenase